MKVEEVNASKLMRRWSRVFHATQWDDLDYELREGRAIEHYRDLRASSFLIIRGYPRGRLEALRCSHPLLEYEILASIHNEVNLDELYVIEESFAWTFILSHEMYSLCPGPIFAVPYTQRPPRPERRSGKKRNLRGRAGS